MPRARVTRRREVTAVRSLCTATKSSLQALQLEESLQEIKRLSTAKKKQKINLKRVFQILLNLPHTMITTWAQISHLDWHSSVKANNETHIPFVMKIIQRFLNTKREEKFVIFYLRHHWSWTSTSLLWNEALVNYIWNKHRTSVSSAMARVSEW